MDDHVVLVKWEKKPSFFMKCKQIKIKASTKMCETSESHMIFHVTCLYILH